MLMTFTQAIWLYPRPVDFRKQLDGLIILVAEHLSMNPSSGQLFLFRNKQANKLKALWWESNGFWLFYKRLEKGKFKYPAQRDGVIALEAEQLSWLLSGLDYTKQPFPTKIKAENFF